MTNYVVATTDEIPPGSRKLVTVRGRNIAVFNVDGDYLAILDRCPHQGGSLCKGKQGGLISSDEPGSYRYTRKGEIIRCPWHGWEFDLRTGQSYCDPTRSYVKSYTTSVEPGTALIEGPYIAETFEVSVDANYIVIKS